MNPRINHQTKFIDLGLIDYKKAWDFQTGLSEQILRTKLQNRELPAADQLTTENFLIFCEHPHVFTLGRTGDENNLLIKKENLDSIQASYYNSNRGGDITYHGPGQLVVYPVIDLENFFTDIHRYMRMLEESVILTLAELGIRSGRVTGLTGVWIDGENLSKARKICALGVKTSRWVTLHGMALNVNTDLGYFDNIVPCGIDDKKVTSLKKELGSGQSMEKVKKILKEKLSALFDMALIM